MKQRNIAIDAIKGLAIIAVALYHFGGGLLPYGYLGVDIFFVVGGYLLIGSLTKQFTERKFKYWQYLIKKIVRLWPLVIAASFLAIGLGFVLMLPDDFENLAESSIASSMFANNILQCITTKNYWNITNLYKPLMHFWYVGVLMQAYVILPLIYLLSVKVAKNARKGMIVGTIGLTLLSFVLYCLPFIPAAWKFYYLPFRVFEITAGGLLTFSEKKAKDKTVVSWLSISVLLIMLCSRIEILSSELMLFITVISTMIFVFSTDGEEFKGIIFRVLNTGAMIGKRSYSIYIWHQIVVAFLFYSFFPEQNLLAFALFAVITTIVSFLSYRLIEVPLANITEKRKQKIMVAVTAIFAIVLCAISFIFYRNAGVVRDVPELNIYKNNVHRGMHAEYCDRPYDWNQDFTEDGRINILILGNSYGRDWANILYEWDKNKQLDISYLYYTEDAFNTSTTKIELADIVFYAVGPGYDGVPAIVQAGVPEEKLYVVGNKCYGKSNGIIYSHRFSKDYFEQVIEVNNDLIDNINCDSKRFGDHFIDMMKPVMVDGTHSNVFTDNGKFISQDCRHLTQSGAIYYANHLDLEWILSYR